MDESTKARLSGLRWIGPALGWLLHSRPWCVYEYLEDRHWSRLAAAVTFISFLALFPLVALGAAAGFLVLPGERMDDVERWVAEQVPGIADALHLRALFDNAATIGVIALALLLPTGLGWVDETRGALRAVWDRPDPPGNALLRRVRDLGVLAGFGGVLMLSVAASVVALTAVRWVAGGALGGVLVSVAAHVVGIGVTAVLMAYLLVWLPGVRPPRRVVVGACLVGALGIEVLKALLGGYLTEVAAKNLYGAFGVPVALLIWMNLMARLLLYCCAWTATSVSAERRVAADALEARGSRAPRPVAHHPSGPVAVSDGSGTGTAAPPGSPPAADPTAEHPGPAGADHSADPGATERPDRAGPPTAGPNGAAPPGTPPPAGPERRR